MNNNNNNNDNNKNVGTSNITSIFSMGGQMFVDFAKNKGWGKDLFEDLVAPYFQSDFIVETWGRPLMPSYCKPTYLYQIINVHQMKINSEIIFDETKDHSKWGITDDNSTSKLIQKERNNYGSRMVRNLVCVGDINRMVSQRQRGGGTTCFVHSGLHSSLKSFISQIYSCSKSSV